MNALKITLCLRRGQPTAQHLFPATAPLWVDPLTIGLVSTRPDTYDNWVDVLVGPCEFIVRGDVAGIYEALLVACSWSGTVIYDPDAFPPLRRLWERPTGRFVPVTGDGTMTMQDPWAHVPIYNHDGTPWERGKPAKAEP